MTNIDEPGLCLPDFGILVREGAELRTFTDILLIKDRDEFQHLRSAQSGASRNTDAMPNQTVPCGHPNTSAPPPKHPSLRRPREYCGVKGSSESLLPAVNVSTC